MSRRFKHSYHQSFPVSTQFLSPAKSNGSRGSCRSHRRSWGSPADTFPPYSPPIVIGEHDSSLGATCDGDELAKSHSAPLRHIKSFSIEAPPFYPSRRAASSLSQSTYTPVETLELRQQPFNAAPDRSHISHQPPSCYSLPYQFPSIYQNTQTIKQGEINGGPNHNHFDPYITPSTSLSTSTPGQPPPQMNPYTQDGTTPGAASYFQNSSFMQPPQYHLYTSLGPHREALGPYQRTAHDFFIPNGLREDLQRKSTATLQLLPSALLFVPR